MKLAPRPWIGCGPGLPPVRIGDERRLDREHLEVRPGRFQHFGAGGDVPAGADAGDDRVDRRVGEIAQDFLRGRAAMNLDVGRIVELLRHPAVRVWSISSLGAIDRARHALFLGREVELRAVSEHQPAAFDAHAVGHDEDELVALHRRDHGEADAGVAGGRLDDRAAGFQLAGPLGVLDHGQRDAVLDRSAGVGPFRLHPHFGAVAEQAVDADVRRIADRLEDIGGLHALALLCVVRRANRVGRSFLQGATRGTTTTTARRRRSRRPLPRSPPGPGR